MLIAKRNVMSGKKLPYARRLAYLESAGEQYIDTHLTFSLNSEIVLSAAYDEVNRLAFGANSATYEMMVSYSNRSYHFFNGKTFWFTLPTGRLEIRLNLMSGEMKMSVNGEVVQTNNSTVTNNRGILIGASYPANTMAIAFQKMKIFGFEYFNNGEKIKSLIPVMSYEGNPEMFDEVTQTFEERHGDFLYGELD